MSKFAAILLVSLLAAGIAGCDAQSRGRRLSRPPKPVVRVDRIEVLSTPVALNFDSRPGPDGVAVKVYLFRVDRPEPVTVEGRLELMLYDQKISSSDLHTREPFHVWRLGPDELAMYLSRGIVGWRYAMDLRWGSRRPRGGTISLVVRYLSPEGPAVYSDPVAIAMGAK